MKKHIADKKFIADNALLMSEWDWPKNEGIGLDPHELTLGSGKKAHWVCSKGHKWEAAINHRAIRGDRCPFCSNKRVLPGYNDLQSQRPDLMEEWDYKVNTISPDAVSEKSNKTVAWICKKGHHFTKRVCNRTSGGGCPVCAHALRTSFPEQCFYFYVKKTFPDAINSYRDIFENGMELDIYIPSIRTGIEYDGYFWHNDDEISREEKKYQICKENNIRLFRIKERSFSGFTENADKIYHIPRKRSDTVLEFYITEFLKHLTLYSTCLPDVNIARDRNKILEYKTMKSEDSLQSLYPDVAEEWHPLKNGKLTPDLFSPGSAEIVWWKCQKCGNEWRSSIVNRTKGHGCDVCATEKRAISRRKTLLSQKGGIDKEWCLSDWDYETNEYGPDHYTNGSGEIVGWKCHKCGYRWKTPICDRTRLYKNGCPLCSEKVIIPGVNDLPTVLPELMQEWDYQNNAEIDPTTVGRGSHLFAFWKCKKCGYVWKAQIYNRSNGKGCPCCAHRVVVPGINDLATTNPKLASEWHPKMNTLSPCEVTEGQNIMVYWLCSECGNVWQDTLNHRKSGRGCSACRRNNRE